MVDREIREILCNYIDEQYNKVRIMDEFKIGESRADVVGLTPSSTQI